MKKKTSVDPDVIGDSDSVSRLHPHRVASFFEEVAAQTGIAVEQQHLLYLGHQLPLEGGLKVVNLPHTSPVQPLILLSYSFEPSHSLPFRERKPSPPHPPPPSTPPPIISQDWLPSSSEDMKSF